jgi:predicted Zn-dependent protease
MTPSKSAIRTWIAAVIISALSRGPLTAAAGQSLADQINESLAQNGNVDGLAATALNTPSDDPLTLRSQIRVEFENGDLDTALPLLRALAVEPSHADPQAQRDLANIYELLGRDDAAMQTWHAIIDHAPDAALTTEARLRLAMLELDNQQPADAIALLNTVAAADKTSAAQAGLIASFYGQYPAAAGYLHDSDGNQPWPEFLAGNAALHAGQFTAAQTAYASALNHSADSRDAVYAAENLITIARKSGQLNALATQWLGDPHFQFDRSLPLAIVLRETGRPADLLKWWHAQWNNPASQNALLSPRFIAEISGAAIETGSADEINTICQELLASDPRREQNFIAAQRLLIDSNDLRAADAMFDTEIDTAANNPSRLQWLGKTAKSLGRDLAARRAARALIALGGNNAVQGLLLDASICLRSNDLPQAEDSLRKAAALAVSYPELAADTASLLDATGMDDDAISLLRSITSQHPDDDLLLQLTSLLIQQQRLPEAMDILDRLRRTTANPGTAAQAGQRLLEIAGTSKTYDRLAENLQSELTAGGTAGDVSLLADVYVAMHRSEAAVSLIRSTTLLDETTRLQRLATLFLRMKEFDRAQDTLKQLVTLQPAQAIATLEQIAWVATERKRADEATQAIADISQQTGKGPIADELMGGIYDRLGWPDQAAACYRKAIAGGQSNPQDWLLWSTAMLKSGRPDVASQRLQILCCQAQSDDLFIVAVDALSNLDAPVPALRAIRRLAILRSSRAPENANLLHLIRDLCQQLSDPAFDRRISETALTLIPDERPQLLRELSEESATDGDIDSAIDFGDSILASGDDFPPQVFLDLGEQLLIARRITDANRAFARAIEASADDLVAPRVAAIYEKYSYFAEAERVIAPLVDRHPLDLPLTETLGREREILGRYHDAFALYLQGLDLAMQQWSAAPKTSNPAPESSGPTTEATDLPPEAADFQRLALSATATARDPQDQTALISFLAKQINRLIQAGPQAPASTVPEMVSALNQALRRVAFISGQADAAERVDESILARWPDDVRFCKAALAARVDAGLFDRAVRFALRHAQVSQLPWPLRNKAERAQTSPSDLPDADAADLPMLIARGKTEQAEQIVRSNVKILPADADAEMPLLIAAASAMNDDESVSYWSIRWLSLAGSPLNRPHAPRPIKLAAEKRIAFVASTVWTVLPPAGRADFIAALIDLGSKPAVPGGANQPALLAAQLARSSGISLPAGIAEQLLTDPASADIVAAQLFACCPAAERPALLRLALQRVSPSHQLSLLLRLTDQTIEAFDDATAQVITDAAGQLPPEQIFPASDWFSNQSQKRVLPALANAILKASNSSKDPADAETTVECAAAFANAAQPDRGDPLALSALEQLMSRPPDAPAALDGAVDPAIRVFQLLRIASVALSKNSCDSLVTRLNDQTNRPGETVWRMICQATILQASGRFSDALVLERKIHANHPDDEMAAQLLADQLENNGQFSELVDTFGPRSGRVWNAHIRRQLARSLWLLNRPEESRQASPDTGAWLPIDPSNAISMAQEFRVQLEHWHRGDQNFLNAQQASAGPAAEKLSDWPGSADDLLASIEAVSLADLHADPASPVMIDMLCDAAAGSSSLTQHLLQAIDARCSSGDLLNSDALILERLARNPNVKINPRLLDALWSRAAAGSEDAFVALADALGAENPSAAKDVNAWLSARQRMSQPLSLPAVRSCH